MKIQFGEKGEVSWDVLEEIRSAEEWQPDHHHHHPPACRERLWRWCCGGSCLSLGLILSVVTLTQLWLCLYVLASWDASPVTHLVFTDDQGKVRHVHFSWSNCGSQSDPVQLTQLQVNPDPVMIDGNITLTLDAYLDRYLDAPISATVKVERKLGWFWVKIPCLESLGSCHYEDLCKLSPYGPSDPCPDPFPRFGLPCRCPVTKGQYKVKGGVFSIPDIVSYLPSWLVTGDYYVHGTAQKHGHSLGCYKLYVSVSH
ncbi:Ganglioside GM2 activator [Chionoecetes opilio]|uniref:Ganglioside GM2 activator n=1 Tax=Chionoecetes opilio TaxID=41210 RepID=A0A8J4XW90_CHIOP|nr:Ganglioside GM2 activator [Chionoecetes opilio]